MTDAPLFTCARCGEPQWPLSPAIVAPEDLLCAGCHDVGTSAAPADPLDAAGIPRAHRAALDREAWSVHFDRPWPASLAGGPFALPRWTYLWGPTGTGKSTCAAILLAEALGPGAPGRWVLGSTLAKAWVQHEVDRSRPVPSVASGFLVVDEVLGGVGNLTAFVAGRWTDLATVRDDADQTTVVTSNLPPSDLVRQLPAAGSRILSGIVLHLAGDDARLRRPA